MENTIVSLIMIAILLTGMLVLAQAGFSSADVVSSAWKDMEVRSSDIARTSIDAVSVTWGSGTVRVTVENEGQVPLRDFEHWDVIMHYYSSGGVYHVERFVFVPGASPGDNEWVVYGIYFNGQTEVFQPGILDPGEQMVIRIRPIPAVADHTTNWVNMATPNGVNASIMLRRG